MVRAPAQRAGGGVPSQRKQRAVVGGRHLSGRRAAAVHFPKDQRAGGVAADEGALLERAPAGGADVALVAAVGGHLC